MKLSVIVPILNEIDQLPLFIEMLSQQQDVELELVLVDGGSDDGTAEYVAGLTDNWCWPLSFISSEKGRARQMNAGAAKARYDKLLFLHVDSIFQNDRSLSIALAELKQAVEATGHEHVAGHFRLKFSRSQESSKFGYYFWEAKARLDRPECTHGDQGFLMSRNFFEKVGPFEANLPIAEDTRLAERVRRFGQWLLLSPEILTSARRFEIEGLKERQTLNALIMNFAAIGWNAFFSEAQSVYRSQSKTDKLDLLQFFALIDRLNRESSIFERIKRWYHTGVYVRPNAWQIAFLRDIKSNFNKEVSVDEVELPRLVFHDKWFDRLTDNIIGRIVAMLGTWFWYRVTVYHYKRLGS